jgi:hypothetical protein
MTWISTATPPTFMNMRKLLIVAASLVSLPALAQEPATWRDPATECTYLKVESALTLRYRRDGSPDCPNVRQPPTNATITQSDFQDLTRSIESLRRDIGSVHRELEDLRRDPPPRH